MLFDSCRFGEMEVEVGLWAEDCSVMHDGNLHTIPIHDMSREAKLKTGEIRNDYHSHADGRPCLIYY